MKLAAGVLALSAFQGAEAFTAGGLQLARKAPTVSMAETTASLWGINEVSPDGKLVQRIEGKTRKTWSFNDLSRDRVQVAIKSEGRPINADVQLWIGPDWTPFTLKAYSDDGRARPIHTLIGTRNKNAMIEVRNVGEQTFPIEAAANYAKGDMIAVPQEIPATTPGERIDGGALKAFPLAESTEQLEVVLKTDGKQLNARIELLNAPNSPKQTFECFTNNGELNSLCVSFNTPDATNTVRVVNLAPLEFPCYIHYNEI